MLYSIVKKLAHSKSKESRSNIRCRAHWHYLLRNLNTCKFCALILAQTSATCQFKVAQILCQSKNTKWFICTSRWDEIGYCAEFIKWQYSCYISCTGVNQWAVRDEYSRWHPCWINKRIHSHVIAKEVNCYRAKGDNYVLYTQTFVTQLLRESPLDLITVVGISNCFQNQNCSKFKSCGF